MPPLRLGGDSESVLSDCFLAWVRFLTCQSAPEPAVPALRIEGLFSTLADR